MHGLSVQQCCAFKPSERTFVTIAEEARGWCVTLPHSWASRDFTEVEGQWFPETEGLEKESNFGSRMYNYNYIMRINLKWFVYSM